MQAHILESMLLGRALAAMSHELKNVLAIVGEGAGLMEDLLEITGNQGCPLPDAVNERLAGTLLTISKQTARGHGLAADLNKLAHLPDSRLASRKPLVDLGETAALAMRLIARRAALGNVAFAQPAATGDSPAADPQLCLAAFLALLEWMLSTAEPGSVITAEALSETQGLEFSGARFPEEPADDLKELAEASGLEIRAGNQRVRITATGSRT